MVVFDWLARPCLFYSSGLNINHPFFVTRYGARSHMKLFVLTVLVPLLAALGPIEHGSNFKKESKEQRIEEEYDKRGRKKRR